MMPELQDHISNKIQYFMLGHDTYSVPHGAAEFLRLIFEGTHPGDYGLRLHAAVWPSKFKHSSLMEKGLIEVLDKHEPYAFRAASHRAFCSREGVKYGIDVCAAPKGSLVDGRQVVDDYHLIR